jgi:two-component system chemotaxis sensor kinase CheA
MAQDAYKYFRPEAREILDRFARGILDLEKGASGADDIHHLLRLAHTLKGAARVVKQGDIANRAHAIEDILSPLRASGAAPRREHIESVLSHLDFIGDQLETLGTENAAIPQQKAGETIRTVRTDLAEADFVVDRVGEAHAIMAVFRHVSEDMRVAIDLADAMKAQFPAVAAADKLCRKIAAIDRSLGTTLDQMDRELRQLRDAAERLRLVPVATLFTTLERTARDTALALSRDVTFAGIGGDVRLDAHVLDTVQGALVQLVRNAVSHGIERGDTRRQAGKDPAGKITVSIARRDRWIVFSCSDDGGGIDFDAVVRAASERGMSDLSAAPADHDNFMRLLLRGGISTSGTVTEHSGRGIGLDVVREAAERLGGKVDCRSAPGQGTIFEIVVPPALSSMDVLIVKSSIDDGAVAMPFDSVRSTRRLTADEIVTTVSGRSILHDGAAIPFVSLARALEEDTSRAVRDTIAVIVAAREGLAAIGIPGLTGTARIVVRPLPPRVNASAVVMAVSLDASGSPQLVLDPDGLVATAHRARHAEPDAVPARRPVLVIDDSLTTRMLEQSILESAGYDVDVAESGEEALVRLRDRDYALILVDVEMPGMDGFTFVERLRADASLRHIPAILVTSLAEPEHRKRGRAVGAQAYIVKSEFDQDELLSMIKPMMAA